MLMLAATEGNDRPVVKVGPSRSLKLTDPSALVEFDCDLREHVPVGERVVLLSQALRSR